MVEQVLVNSSSLSSIGNAIRTKKGLPAESTFTPSEMSEQINSMPVIPEDALTITDNCVDLFKNGKFSFMINIPGVKTKDINAVSSMFYDCTDITEIPFDLNFKSDNVTSLTNTFYNCKKLKKLPKLNNLEISSCDSAFYCCYELEDVSSLADIDLSYMNTYKYVRYTNIFSDTCKLKEIPYSFLSKLYNINTGWKYTIYNNQCFYESGIYALRGLPVTPYEYANNMFSQDECFYHTGRLKSLTFDTDNSNPKVVRWTNQTIFLKEVGFNDYPKWNAEDKRIWNDATYQALKNDPDSWSNSLDYSKYNHDSAVETINSLPDTSAYIATAGGTNTIKFNGYSGAKTDGGAISTLTEEEIAVAAAKGWTVTLV